MKISLQSEMDPNDIRQYLFRMLKTFPSATIEIEVDSNFKPSVLKSLAHSIDMSQANITFKGDVELVSQIWDSIHQEPPPKVIQVYMKDFMKDPKKYVKLSKESSIEFLNEDGTFGGRLGCAMGMEDITEWD